MQGNRGLREILGYLKIKPQIEVSIPILLKKFIIRQVPTIHQHHLLIVLELIALKGATFTMIKDMD